MQFVCGINTQKLSTNSVDNYVDENDFREKTSEKRPFLLKWSNIDHIDIYLYNSYGYDTNLN